MDDEDRYYVGFRYNQLSFPGIVGRTVEAIKLKGRKTLCAKPYFSSRRSSRLRPQQCLPSHSTRNPCRRGFMHTSPQIPASSTIASVRGHVATRIIQSRSFATALSAAAKGPLLRMMLITDRVQVGVSTRTLITALVAREGDQDQRQQAKGSHHQPGFVDSVHKCQALD